MGLLVIVLLAINIAKHLHTSNKKLLFNCIVPLFFLYSHLLTALLQKSEDLRHAYLCLYIYN